MTFVATSTESDGPFTFVTRACMEASSLSVPPLRAYSRRSSEAMGSLPADQLLGTNPGGLQGLGQRRQAMPRLPSPWLSTSTPGRRVPQRVSGVGRAGLEPPTDGL